MKRFKLKIGLYVDDVLLECIPHAIKLANEKYLFDPPITQDEVTGWGESGKRTDVIFEFLKDENFYVNQPIMAGAKEFVKKLSKKAEIFIITAVYPSFMSVRAKRIMEAFPEVLEENIIMGKRKDVVMMDIVLDDGGHNVLSSKSTYPVLLRNPWNYYITGGLSVNNYDDFLHFVNEVQNSYIEKETNNDNAPIVLIGPSGSGKNKIADELCKKEVYQRVMSYTDNPGGRGCHKKVSNLEFKKMESNNHFLETTVYNNNHYGCTIDDIKDVITEGKVPVLVLDICGAIALRRIYPDTNIFYIKKTTKEFINNILEKNLSNEDKTNRILSLDLEKKNEELCDFTVRSIQDLFLYLEVDSSFYLE